MADIFISYSKAQRDLTESLADDLKKRGYTVWWDTDLRAGEAFGAKITRELSAAQVAVVIWTAASVQSEWVLAEAEEARGTRKLLSVRDPDLPVNAIPLQFRTRHIITTDERQALFASIDEMGVRPNPEALEESEDELVKSQWERLQQTDSVEDLLHFEEYFPTSYYSTRARLRRDDLTFGAADKNGSLQSYSAYLGTFPNGRHASLAREKGGELSFRAALEKASIEAFEQHIKSWPGGNWEKKARDWLSHEKYFGSVLDRAVKDTAASIRNGTSGRSALTDLLSSLENAIDRKRWGPEAERRLLAELDRIDWERAASENSDGSYRLYVELQPNGERLQQALKAIERIAWDTAHAAGTPEAARQYLAHYPAGLYLQQATERIDKLEWERASQENSDEAYSRYIGLQPSGKYRDAAEKAPDERDWKIASAAKTRDAYGQYLTRHPSGQKVHEAMALVDEIDWEAASEAGTDEAYARYLQAHPTGKYREAAENAPDERDWKIADAAKTREAYQGYMARHSSGRHAAEAAAIVDDMDWESTSRADTDEAYARYLQAHPTGKYRQAAENAPDERDWKRSIRSNTIESYEQYQHAHPTGRNKITAEHLIDKIRRQHDVQLWNETQAIGTTEAYAAFLKQRPNSPFSDQARYEIEQARWDIAFRKCSIPEFEYYLQTYPNGRFKDEALAQIARLSKPKPGDKSKSRSWF